MLLILNIQFFAFVNQQVSWYSVNQQVSWAFYDKTSLVAFCDQQGLD